MGSDQHLLAAYGQSDSWTLGYNLFADAWLGTNLVESSVGVLECSLLAVSDQFQVYNGHSNFIYDLMSSNFSNYGMPIDNAVPIDTSAAVSSWCLFISYILSLTFIPSLGWSLFVAAMTPNTGLRSGLVSKVYNGTSVSRATNPAFAVYYNTTNGTPLQGVNR